MMRLCLALGGKSLEERERTMSARELAKWQVFDRMYPIGDVRGDLRIGNLADLLLAAHGGTPQGPWKWVFGHKEPEPQEVSDENVAGLLGLTFGE